MKCNISPRGISFDLDETLILHSRPISELLHESLLRLDSALAPALDVFDRTLSAAGAKVWQSFASISGQGESMMLGMFEEALSSIGVSAELAGQLLKLLLEAVERSTSLAPDALRVLDALRSNGLEVAIVTNGFELLQHRKAAAHGLLDRVATLVTSETAGAHKPHPKIFKLALERLDLPAAQVWHVGDSIEKDIVGARRVGMTAVLFDGRKRHGAKISAPSTPTAGPDHVIRGLRDLLALI